MLRRVVGRGFENFDDFAGFVTEIGENAKESPKFSHF